MKCFTETLCTFSSGSESHSLLCFSHAAISLVLYDKRFGLLQEKVNEEAMNFITAVKTVNMPVIPHFIATVCTIDEDL